MADGYDEVVVAVIDEWKSGCVCSVVHVDRPRLYMLTRYVIDAQYKHVQGAC